MDKVKNYFKEKKVDAKFATAGPGQKLGGPNTTNLKISASHASTNDSHLFNPARNNTNNSSLPESSNIYITQDKKVYFRCPHIDPGLSLPRDQMIERVREFLFSNLTSDPIYFSTLVIKTLNSNTVAQNAISILVKYLENLKRDLSNPTFRRIRCQNKIFLEKVRPVEGAYEFLSAIGFVPQLINRENTSSDVQDLGLQAIPQVDEEFLCIPDAADQSLLLPEKLETAIEILTKVNGLKLTLDRDVRLFRFMTAMPKFEAPDNFFQQSLEELRSTFLTTRAKVDLESKLRTRAMKEADNLRLRGGVDGRSSQNAPYTFVRIKFPQNVVLQGTFEAEEPFTNVIEFVKNFSSSKLDSNSDHSSPGFNLITSWGEKLIPEKAVAHTAQGSRTSGGKSAPNTIRSTLRELKLVPTALLIFHPNEIVGKQEGKVAAVAKASVDTYLNSEALARLKII